MAKEPENLVLRRLQEIRAEITGVRATQETHGKVLDSIAKETVKHTMHFESLEERFELLREGTVSAIGFSAPADRQYRSVKDQLVDLTKRVQKLEKSR